MDVLFNFGYLDLIFITSSVSLLLLWVRSRRPSDYPPGPTPIPVIGNFHNLVNKDFMQSLRDLRQKHGDIFSLSLGTFWVIVVNGSDNLKEILIKRGEKTSDRPKFFVFNLVNNRGIISASGPSWKHHRTFALSKLRDFGFGKRSFESNIHEELEIFLNELEKYDEQAFDISEIIHTSMSNIVMAITLGRRFDYKDPEFSYFVQLLNENFNNAAVLGPVNFIPILEKLPIDIFGAKQMSKNAERCNAFLQNEINEHEKTLDENNIRDFIDAYLVELRQERDTDNYFSGANLLASIGDLFAAGTETTATTIRWALMYLLNNMDIQHKMWKEINENVGSGRLPSLSDKPNLPYCEAVILESLRLGNIVPFSLPHTVSEDIYYKGMKIPKDSVIFPSLDSVVYDDSLFPNSHIFNPERFIDENGKLCGQEKILTFSLGRRVCLGESLARLELFLYLTALVQRFQFLPPEGDNPPAVEGKLGVTYSPILYKIRAVRRS
ncbi:unnamed protein product [Mytilus edulis]|uniref:Cytochrome P450 n=1 Tax=Mytilus edulis TaxID=6550 RepID=A0A8S3VJ10_MYTED|nr:unnamed protein product [Mytilus edulis]